jgi:hypothetical protein
MDIKNRFDKAYEEKSFSELAAAPVHALQGVSKKDGELLYQAFYIRTVADLANLKYAKWAREICELAEYAPDSTMIAFRDKLDKKYEKKKPGVIAKSPVDALQGVSKKDAQLLKKAFSIRTVRDLANLKYIKWAQEVVDMALPETAADASIDETRRPMKAFSWIILIIILVILAIIFWPRIRSIMSGTGCQAPQRDIPPYTGDTLVEGRKAPQAVQKAETPAAKEEVSAPVEKKAPVVEAVKAPRECNNCYTVKWRDSFINISERLSGDWRNWEKLYNANRDVVKDTRLLIPGTQLRLPEGFSSAPKQ